MQRIQKLNPRHFKILELCLRGWTRDQIAEHLKMSKQMVSIVTQSDCFQHQLAKRRDKYNENVDMQIANDVQVVDDAIKEHALSAAQRLGIEIDSAKTSADRIRAAEAVLDRAGHPRTQRTENKSVNVNIDADYAQLITETMEMDVDE